MAPTLESIEHASRDELIKTWKALLKVPPSKSLSQPLMRRILIFELQAKQFGGLDRKTKAVIKTYQNHKKSPPTKSPKLKPGAYLMREWNGITHRVEVIDGGFIWNGSQYKSLSSIAKLITGAHWSGPRFFGLNAGVQQ